MRCANDHPAIDHEEFYCPLCVALEDHRDLETEHYDCKETATQLAEYVDELCLADVVHLEAQVEAAEADAAAERARVAALLWAIEGKKPKPMARYILHVRQAAVDARGGR